MVGRECMVVRGCSCLTPIEDCAAGAIVLLTIIIVGFFHASIDRGLTRSAG